jgi:signal transduction histidine kinase
LLPLKDARSGALLGFGKILRDRTDLKAQIELLENQLQQARQGDREKDRAITKLSHELRNVIAGLQGAVQLLDQPSGDEQRQHKFKHLMHEQLAVIAQLTQDLLDVKRAEGGKVALHFERVVVQNVLRDLLTGLEQRLRAHELTAQMLAPPADIVVDADPVRLHQIFGNLLDNAIKYTPPEGRIWVKLTVEEHSVLIHIEDTGRGIPPDMLHSIFELFTQVDAHRSTGGLGVGLALVRELVSLHGGSVQATSKGADQGSEFTVRLPLAAVVTGT